MRRFLVRFGKHRRGIAALEFGICAPFLIAGMAAAFDYGYAMWARSCLATAVSEGAYYAILTGTTVTTTNIAYVVQHATSLSGIQIPTGGVSAQFYACPSGTPASLVTQNAATPTCPIPPSTTGTGGGNAGVYITITAQYTLTTIWQTLPSVISETVTVRLV
jgi:Flp pilus assembly protein TadG